MWTVRCGEERASCGSEVFSPREMPVTEAQLQLTAYFFVVRWTCSACRLVLFYGVSTILSIEWPMPCQLRR